MRAHIDVSGSEATMDILAENVVLVLLYQDKLESSGHRMTPHKQYVVDMSVLLESTANVAIHLVEFHLCVKLQSVMQIRKSHQQLR